MARKLEDAARPWWWSPHRRTWRVARTQHAIANLVAHECIQLVLPTNRHMPLRVRVLVDFIVQRLAAQ